jgi:proteasome lid subunit RPN8/RPN11
MPMTLADVPRHELRRILEPFADRARVEQLISVTPVGGFDDVGDGVVRGWPVDGGRLEQRSNGQLVEVIPMLQAVRSFTADYDGERIEIDTNTRVAVSHDIARRHPEMFVPVDHGSAGMARSRSRGSVTARPRPPVPRPRPPAAAPLPSRPEPSATIRTGGARSGVDLRETPSPVAVHIPDRVLVFIAEECARFQESGYETGGLLAASVSWSWHRRLDVSFARGPGPRAEHHRTVIVFDTASYVALDRELAVHESDYRLAGCWHSHPSGQSLPSETDLRSWLAGLDHIHEAHGSARYLGVIAVPRPGYAPTLHPYLVSRPRWGKPICEPAGGNR